MQDVGLGRSKYALSDLTLNSIVELERLLAGLDCNRETFARLAEALQQASEPTSGTTQFRFIEPGYYEPFERLYRNASSAFDGDVAHIQGFMKKVGSELTALAMDWGKPEQTLLPFCIALHSELIRELTVEDHFVGSGKTAVL